MTRLFEMRLIEHLAVERRDARAVREGGGNFRRVFDVGGRRRERSVDRVDLVRMDREHAAETFALRQARGALKTFGIAKIRVQRFYGVDAGGLGGDEHKRAHHLVDEEKLAMLVTVCRRSECGR